MLTSQVALNYSSATRPFQNRWPLGLGEPRSTHPVSTSVNTPSFLTWPCALSTQPPLSPICWRSPHRGHMAGVCWPRLDPAPPRGQVPTASTANEKPASAPADHSPGSHRSCSTASQIAPELLRPQRPGGRGYGGLRGATRATVAGDLADANLAYRSLCLLFLFCVTFRTLNPISYSVF